MQYMCILGTYIFFGQFVYFINNSHEKVDICQFVGWVTILLETNHEFYNISKPRPYTI